MFLVRKKYLNWELSNISNIKVPLTQDNKHIRNSLRKLAIMTGHFF